MKFWLLGFLLLSLGASAEPVHAIAMHGKPKYDENFTHFDYVNPNAPKGGVLKQASFGSFDTFNPFTIKGNSAPGVGLIFETLMTSSADEPFTQYGLIADKIDTPADRSYVRFHINDKAYFNNGDKMTPDDVIFSFETLRDFGAPQYRYYYRDVAKGAAEKDGWIRFELKTGENRELPLILGLMPVLSKKDWKDKDFTATRLDVPVGSGAYKLKDFALNRYVIYERDKNYWGKDLPVNQGINNFDEIRFDIYRDTTVAVEAFKSGAYDIRVENEAKKWATAYNTPDMKTGKMKRQEFSHHLPSGMQGFVFNTRKELFKDKKVREALQYVLDFNWLNDKLFYSSYTRTKSYFDNSYLAATGKPSTEEIKLLTPFKDKLDPRVLGEEILVPQLDSANPRVQLMKALSLLKQAGWTVQNGILQNQKGEPFEFEILLDFSGAGASQRIVLPFVRNLKKIGIKANVRVMDALQYKQRLDDFDFDMFVMVWGQSLSPGNEQRYYWGSSSADQKGSYNFAGIKDETVDFLIEKIVSAKTTEELQTSTRALARVLMWGFYVIPQWHMDKTRIVHWDKFGFPKVSPMQGISIMSWWCKKECK